jgi:3-oxoadipate enol-lactonase
MAATVSPNSTLATYLFANIFLVSGIRGTLLLLPFMAIFGVWHSWHSIRGRQAVEKGMIETRYIRANGVRTFVQVAGAGEPIVFIHGALLNSFLWRPQLDYFGATNFCVSYDLRGHGRTGPSSEVAYTTSLFARDLRALLDALRLGQVTLCGLSLGGMIAQTFAELYPQRIRCLVLCDTAFSTFAGAVEMLLNTVVGVVTPSVIRTFGAGNYCALNHWVNRLSGQGGWVSQTLAGRMYASRALASVPGEEMIKVYRSVLAFRGCRLDGFTGPALLINGASDSPLILRQARLLQQQLPHAEYQIVPRAGHLANLDNPVEFNRVLDRFLMRTAAESVQPVEPDLNRPGTTDGQLPARSTATMQTSSSKSCLEEKRQTSSTTAENSCSAGRVAKRCRLLIRALRPNSCPSRESTS